MDRSHAKPRPEGKPKREVIYIAQTKKQTNGYEWDGGGWGEGRSLVSFSHPDVDADTDAS